MPGWLQAAAMFQSDQEELMNATVLWSKCDEARRVALTDTEEAMESVFSLQECMVALRHYADMTRRQGEVSKSANDRYANNIMSTGLLLQQAHKLITDLQSEQQKHYDEFQAFKAAQIEGDGKQEESSAIQRAEDELSEVEQESRRADGGERSNLQRNRRSKAAVRRSMPADSRHSAGLRGRVDGEGVGTPTHRWPDSREADDTMQRQAWRSVSAEEAAQQWSRHGISQGGEGREHVRQNFISTDEFAQRQNRRSVKEDRPGPVHGRREVLGAHDAVKSKSRRGIQDGRPRMRILRDMQAGEALQRHNHRSIMDDDRRSEGKKHTVHMWVHDGHVDEVDELQRHRPSSFGDDEGSRSDGGRLNLHPESESPAGVQFVGHSIAHLLPEEEQVAPTFLSPETN
mmetsp:Transcript_138776/g.360679  ORF Transcript_138776/g.360679 Transcript_138776/m.360679 type:complete len:401 (+) Transcript_138776:542-1744(+)